MSTRRTSTPSRRRRARRRPAIDALLKNPAAAVLLADGSLLVADQDNHRVRKVTGGTITTFAGTGIRGFAGDGGPASAARLDTPAESPWMARARVHRGLRQPPHPQGRAGRHHHDFRGSGTRGVSGDGGPATGAALSFPRGLAVSPRATSTRRRGRFIRKVTPAEAISTVAGNRVRGTTATAGRR